VEKIKFRTPLGLRLYPYQLQTILFTFCN